VLARLVAPAEPPLHHVRRLSFTALSTFEQCSYKYYALYVARMAERRPEHSGGDGGLRATEIGDAVHRLLEQVDLAAPAVPDLEQVRVWYPTVSDEELERISAFVASYCDSELARRISALPVAKERRFTFEHDGVLLNGFLDALYIDGPRALVLDYKTNLLGESSPEEIVEADYALQRLVYALACFRAGAEDVEVVYHFLERADAVVSTRFTRDQIAELEAELSAGIARIHAGEFRPTPSDFACAGCPALDLVCAGPRLREPSDALAFSAS
jgi:RecB family exonuclease